MVTLRVKFVGTGSNSFNDFRLHVVGDAGIAYSQFDDDCGYYIPDGLEGRELFTNATLEGNMCWQVTRGDADSLMMYMDPDFFTSAPRVWFSLQ